jgi:predicted TIM-barrel fold metal-dependent hydrolase
MWGSDFPHSVGTFPRSRDHLDEAFAQVDASTRRQILLETPAAYFGLDLDAEITPTP